MCSLRLQLALISPSNFCARKELLVGPSHRQNSPTPIDTFQHTTAVLSLSSTFRTARSVRSASVPVGVDKQTDKSFLRASSELLFALRIGALVDHRRFLKAFSLLYPYANFRQTHSDFQSPNRREFTPPFRTTRFDSWWAEATRRTTSQKIVRAVVCILRQACVERSAGWQ